MNTKSLAIGALVFATFSVQATELPKTELVKGYYDLKNDWIVFEWNDPEDGKIQAIYDSSNKIKPVAHAAVSFDQGSGVYTYSFRFENRAGALQLLQDIFIDHRSLIISFSTPSNEWVAGEYQKMGVWEFEKGFGAVHGIPAGQTVSGFSLKSKGLPSLVNIEFVGRRRVHISSPSPDDDTEELLQSFDRVYKKLEAQYPDKFADTVKQKTIGPGDAPADFNAAKSIQSLIALIKESRTQGWIDNDGIVNGLVAKLNVAATKIVSDPKAAKKALGAFLNDIQAQNGKHLSSEAYALLYFNGQYTISRM